MPWVAKGLPGRLRRWDATMTQPVQTSNWEVADCLLRSAERAAERCQCHKVKVLRTRLVDGERTEGLYREILGLET